MEIKKIGEDRYQCPECGVVYNGKEWNDKTSEIYGNGLRMMRIENVTDEVCCYMCPICENESDYRNIGIQEETVTITKREYDELLEIKFRYEELE